MSMAFASLNDDAYYNDNADWDKPCFPQFRDDDYIASDIRKVIVHEHRAPTDLSVQLLNEMQDAARKNIIDQVVLKNNIVEAVAIAFIANSGPIAATDIATVKVFMRYIINGKEFNTKYNYDQIGFERFSLISRLAEEISRKLTQTIIYNWQVEINKIR